MNILDNKVEESKMIQAACDFWFNDHEHIRSPFPEYVRAKSKAEAISSFSNWVNNLLPEAQDEMNDEMIAEKFEETLFEKAAALVITEDERITILYPFLPRVGDIVNDDKKDGIVSDRHIYEEKDHKFLKVKLKSKDVDENWETSFELPL